MRTNNTIAQRFGNWNKALKIAELMVNHPMGIGVEALFKNLEEVWL